MTDANPSDLRIDGFRPEHVQPFVGFTPSTARRFYGVLGRLGRRFGVQGRRIAAYPARASAAHGQPQLRLGYRVRDVRAAIANQAPMLPLAAVGGDELFSLLGNAYQRGERWLHRRVPLPLPSSIVPIPHFVPWRFVLGEPIPRRFSADRADDPAALRQL